MISPATVAFAGISLGSLLAYFVLDTRTVGLCSAGAAAVLSVVFHVISCVIERRKA
jgi:hypothetical protein